MGLRVEPAMTKGRARNDGIGHPGPDPGSNSSVCTDESRMSMTGEAFLSRPHCPDSLRSSVCTDEPVVDEVCFQIKNYIFAPFNFTTKKYEKNFSASWSCGLDGFLHLL